MMSQAIGLVQHDTPDTTIHSLLEQAVDPPYVAHQPLQAEVGYAWCCWRKPASHPYQHIMRQHPQQVHHRLGRKTLLVTDSPPQALLVLFECGLCSPASVIIEVHIGHKHCLGIKHL